MNCMWSDWIFWRPFLLRFKERKHNDRNRTADDQTSQDRFISHFGMKINIVCQIYFDQDEPLSTIIYQDISEARSAILNSFRSEAIVLSFYRSIVLSFYHSIVVPQCVRGSASVDLFLKTDSYLAFLRSIGRPCTGYFPRDGGKWCDQIKNRRRTPTTKSEIAWSVQ
jgi:hypothetical protein